MGTRLFLALMANGNSKAVVDGRREANFPFWHCLVSCGPRAGDNGRHFAGKRCFEHCPRAKHLLDNRKLAGGVEMTDDDKKVVLSSDQKDAAKSTLGGAVAGAVVGTAVGTPVIGTLVGAVSGAVIGARKKRAKSRPARRRTPAKASPARKRAGKATAKKSKSAPKRKAATRSPKKAKRGTTKAASTSRAKTGRKRSKTKAGRGR